MEAEVARKKPLVSVEFGGEAPPVVLRDVAGALEWFRQQETELSWIGVQGGGSPHAMWLRVQSQLAAGRANILEKLVAAAREPTEAEKTQITSHAKAAFAGDLAILAPGTPSRRFLAEYEKTDRAAAQWCAAYLVNPQDPLTNHAASIRGYIRAEMFRLGHAGSVDPAERASLADVRADWGKFSGPAREEHVRLTGEFQELVGQVEGTHKGQGENFNTMMKDARERLDQIENLFREKLAFKEPATYWSDRARGQGFAAVVWSTVFLVFAALALLGLLWFAGKLGFEVTDTVPPQIWKIGALVGAAALFAWPLRIVARLLVSALHVRADALERATMVTTYLSLIENPQAGLTNEDRSLFLAALFRPASTGMVADDAAPASSWDLLSRLLGGKG